MSAVGKVGIVLLLEFAVFALAEKACKKFPALSFYEISNTLYILGQLYEVIVTMLNVIRWSRKSVSLWI